MDDTLEKLQEQIEAEMREIYTETVIDHAMNPRNVGVLPGADGWASFGVPRAYFFRKEEGSIQDSVRSGSLSGSCSGGGPWKCEGSYL